MSEDRYSGEVYFIVPNERNENLLDLTAIRMVNELHSGKRINNLFLKTSEGYPLVEKYACEGNINLTRINDNSELLEEITGHYGGPELERFVYVTNSEDMGDLKEVVSELADWGFYSEFRIPNSF